MTLVLSLIGKRKFPLRYVGRTLAMRSYHSYPDPNELPVITSKVSDYKKTVSKDGKEFEAMKKFSMGKVFAGVPQSLGIKNTKAPETEVSYLPNGLTVASQELPGLMSSFALIVGTGSAFETQSGPEANTGVTQMLEQSAFRSTYKRSHEEMMIEIEQLGGMVQCIASRESIMYCIDIFRENAEQALDILSDSVLCARLTSEEIEETKGILAIQPDFLPCELISRDAVQRAAYISSPLGQHHYTPVELIDRLDSSMVQRFRAQHLYGSNCVLSGAGIDHELFVKIAREKFSSLPSGSLSPDSLPVSRYTGGLVLNERELKEPYVRLGLGFEIGGWHHDDLVTACLVQTLLGGGSSFSAGGPGKGMYSRLYREVLNRNHWIEAAESFVSIHEHSGVFGIDGACTPGDLTSLFRTFLDQLLRLSVEPVTEIELSRAKNMLKSMLLMQLESRLILCEDIAKQIITYKKRDSPIIICEKIDQINQSDIIKFAKNMLQSNPAIGCAGIGLSNMPDYNQLLAFTNNYRQHVWNTYEKKE